MTGRTETGRQGWPTPPARREDAFTNLHRQYGALVRCELHKRLAWADVEDLGDLEQEIWIAAWCALPNFHSQSSHSTWMVGITKNVVGSWLRRRRRCHTLQATLERAEQNGDFAAEENGTPNRLALHEALEHLASTEKQVIYLRYFEAMTDRDIAQRLGLSLGTVKGRLRAGLTHLRRDLTPEYAGTWGGGWCRCGAPPSA
ncbi:MAG TPA: sigma-70 family RNA polymerase sigma factor [Methylomirabilota bacterium]|nr:sigma-70 family RNA polymerase sigma factor [Methylomirabilota bacterium]